VRGRVAWSTSGLAAGLLGTGLLLALLPPVPKLLAATPELGDSPAAPAAPALVEILEYRIEGNSKLTVIDIEEAVYPYLGPGRRPDDVEAARASLEAAYADKGFATVGVEIPPQQVRDGIVRLKVIERPVGRVRVTGSRYFLLSDVKAQVPSLAPGEVPDFDKVEQEIIDANQLPDRQVTPVLTAGVAPGTVDVELQVKDKFPLHGSLELNNRKSPDTEPLRLVASLRYDNLWQRGDSISFSYQVAPQRVDDSEVFSGSYLARVPGSRLSLLAYGLKSDSDVASVGGSSVIGKGEVVGARALYPLSISGGFIQSVSGGMDYKHFDETVALGADNEIPAPITYYPFTLGYMANWIEDGSDTGLGADLVFAFRGLGSSTQQFANKRSEAKPDFFILQGNAEHTQTIWEDAQLAGKFHGQATADALISNEQFSLGGLDSVRGYLESEVLSDYGLSLQAEARTPSLGPLIGEWVDEWRFYVFHDFGWGGIHDPLPDQDGSTTLSAAGVGTRIKLFEHINGSVDVGVALKSGPSTDAQNVRTNFRAWGEF